MEMKRYLADYIVEDLKKKIVLLTGPRQSGKTTLSKMLSSNYDYLNFDNPEHRLGLIERSWDRSRDLIIFDELHKLKNWKSWLKGVYDTEGVSPEIIVTGSAKLDTYRKVGDSLAGRFFQFRLHPFDLKEIKKMRGIDNVSAALDQLLEVGGFPEPYLEGDSRFYNRWKRSHLDIILRQDMIELENVQHLASIETLIQLLRQRVGSPVSYSSLARDLQCSDKTVKRWLEILETMYVVFSVRPFHRNIARSLLKAPKYYFYDTGQVLGHKGVKLENLTACALLKEIHFLEDCFGEWLRLHYLKTKNDREIDFFVSRDDVPLMLVEVKWADGNLSRNFSVFEKYFPGIKKVQIVKELAREKTYPGGAEVRLAANWLADFSLGK
jgi:predicted AAA+ superfamily ATPase